MPCQCHVGWRPSQTSHVCATSAKTTFKTAEGPCLPSFRKLGDGSYPVLRSRDENQTRRQIEGPKVKLFLFSSVCGFWACDREFRASWVSTGPTWLAGRSRVFCGTHLYCLILKTAPRDNYSLLLTERESRTEIRERYRKRERMFPSRPHPGGGDEVAIPAIDVVSPASGRILPPMIFPGLVHACSCYSCFFVCFF
jgi:hypothetical protein